MRRLFAWLVLLAIAAGLWYGARWFRQSRSLEATLVFDRPQAVRSGTPVVFSDKTIGKVIRVTRLENRQAVVVRVDREFRNQVRNDSLFAVEGKGREARLVVSSRVALGRAVEDGAVIHVRDRKLARMIDRGAEAVVPLAKEWSDKTIETLKTYDRAKLEQQFDEWSARVPEWKKSGGEVYDRNIAGLRVRVNQAEKELRQAGRNVDADRLRARWNQWLESFNSDESEAGDDGDRR